MSKYKTNTGILSVDFETSYMMVETFGLKQYDYIPHENVVQDWSIYCGSFKFVDQPKVFSVSVDPNDLHNDKALVEEVREVFAHTKLLVGHNLDKFDLKKFNTRLIYHKLPPIDHKILTFDTLKAAKKHFSFTSNRLDYLGQFLGIGNKIYHKDGNPWRNLNRGIDVKKTLKHMVEYCENDVYPLLEQVYLRLRPYVDHPKLGGSMNHDNVYCTHCGSQELQSRGLVPTKSGYSRHNYQCKERNCMGWSSYKEPIIKDSDFDFTRLISEKTKTR